MKDAMWSVDPISGTRFSGYAGSQEMLFDPKPDLEPLSDALVDRFTNESASVEEIEMFVIEHTDYKTTHYKRVLRDLETSGAIACTTERKRRNTYPPGTRLQFMV